MRRALVVLCSMGLAACARAVEPGRLADFQPAVGSSMFTACTEANEGHRFALQGVLVLSGEVVVDEDKLTLPLYAEWSKGEGGGARTFVELREGKHVSFDVRGLEWKQQGFRRQEGKGVIEGVTLHTVKGDATLGTPMTAVVELKVMRLFGEKKPMGCRLELVELRP